MTDVAAGQQTAFERIYSVPDERWAFHDDPDPAVRLLRDRRLQIALSQLRSIVEVSPPEWRVLVVCGGVGGEATWLLDQGFEDVTVSDFSESALTVCHRRESRAQTLVLDAEALALPDGTYDLVLVQDGLHHLRRPALGLTEMLRVAARAVVVIEPHDGLVGRLLGKRWEVHGAERNFVFRWTGRLLEQTVRSYLLGDEPVVMAKRLWDHNVVVGKFARKISRREPLKGVQRIYMALRPFDRIGNMLIAVVVKDRAGPP